MFNQIVEMVLMMVKAIILIFGIKKHTGNKGLSWYVGRFRNENQFILQDSDELIRRGRALFPVMPTMSAMLAGQRGSGGISPAMMRFKCTGSVSLL